MKSQMKKLLASKGVRVGENGVKLSSLSTDSVFKVFLKYFTVEDLKDTFFTM